MSVSDVTLVCDWPATVTLTPILHGSSRLCYHS